MARKHGLMGEVNLLGLNSLGENPGLNPFVGALIGGGTANLTSMAVGNLAMFQTMTTRAACPSRRTATCGAFSRASRRRASCGSPVPTARPARRSADNR